MQSTKSSASNKDDSRLLKLVQRQRSRRAKIISQGEKFLIHSNSRVHTFTLSQLNRLVKDGYLTKKDDSVCLTEEGGILLKKILHPDAEFTKLGQVLETCTVSINGEIETVSINLDESPLARLFSRTTKQGISYINEFEFRAGEKLRQDFEKGQLQPHISANWSANMSDGGGGSGFGKNDISDMALDARERVNGAMQKLGPELAGVAVDVCCFLKGIELVERERQWPRRSAKLMLKTALGMLARHYGLSIVNQKHSDISAWGTSDYRPGITTVPT